MKALAPLGRFLFAMMFVFSGFNHFARLDETIGYARTSGVPMPAIGVVVSGAVLLVGGLCIILGAFTRVAAAAIAVFLLLAAFLVHDFWTFSDPQQAQQQLGHFLSNITMAGGALLITYFGPGPISVHSRRTGASRVSVPIGRPLRPRPQE